MRSIAIGSELHLCEIANSCLVHLMLISNHSDYIENSYRSTN